uniref:MFS transporter n=1 Tax=Vaginimicrobium propionicum TaxID=1871034 RepID=UPI0012EBE1BD|nr:MFS transporter [Vaginimicrobium propionicum]
MTTDAPNRLLAWVMWTLGALAYIAAALSRTSFGVAGKWAAERFNVSPSALGVFVIVQLMVYALMQVPAGLILDWIGSRYTIAIGLAVIAIGQIGLALTTSYWLGIFVRILIGGGDALIWSSVIRLIPSWFESKYVPLMTQFSSMTGQLGQWLSAVPLVAVLSTHGWTPAFLAVAACSLLALLLDLLFVRDTPEGGIYSPGSKIAGIGGVKEVISRPGVRLGFYVHFTTNLSQIAFALMWGYSYLQEAQGFSLSQASLMFALMVLANMIFSPLIGILTARFPAHRVELALGSIVYVVASWTAVLLLPTPAPLWLMVNLIVAMAVCTPMSNIGFELNRYYAPKGRMGTGSGVVVVGGFLSALTLIGLIAIVLAILGHSPKAWQIAMACQYPLWIIGTLGIFVARKKTLKQLTQ